MLVGVFEVRLTPKQHDIGVFEILGHLAVIVHHRVIQGVDALEIFGVQHVLRAGARGRALSKIGFEQGEDRPEHGQTGRAESRSFLQPSRQLGIDQREQNDAGRVLDLDDDTVELRGGSDQG